MRERVGRVARMRMAPGLLITLSVLCAAGVAAEPDEDPIHAAAVAVLPSKPSRWSSEPFAQTIWPEHTVLHMTHNTFPHAFPFVAVDRQLRAFELTESSFVHTRDAGALARFNGITRSEGTRIGPDNLEAYARFFLRVHVHSAGLYLPSREVALALLHTPEPDTRRAREVERSMATREPVLKVDVTESGYRVVAYGWRYWFDGLFEHVVCIGRDGVVDYVQAGLGTRRKPKVAVDDPAPHLATVCG